MYKHIDETLLSENADRLFVPILVYGNGGIINFTYAVNLPVSRDWNFSLLMLDGNKNKIGSFFDLSGIGNTSGSGASILWPNTKFVRLKAFENTGPGISVVIRDLISP